MAVGYTGSLLIADHQARLPAIETARGRAWVLLAGQYEEAERARTGTYRSCRDIRDCMDSLGWPLTTRRLPDKGVHIDASPTHFRAVIEGEWREGGPGRWVLEAGGVPTFEPLGPQSAKK